MSKERLEGVESRHVHALWRRLAEELSGILDAHGICAAAAHEIARFAQSRAVVGIREPFNSYYNVWLCQPDGAMEQMRWEGDRASFEPLLAHGRAILQDKLELPANELINSELWRHSRQLLLFSPLPTPTKRSQITPPGALCLLDPAPDCPVTIDNIEELANFLTVYLDRALLRQRSDQQDVEFGIVSDISYSITSTLNLEDIFQQVADATRRTLNAESISIGLIEPASGEIIFVDTLMGPHFHDLPPIRLRPGQGIAGWVAENGQPLIVNDVYKDQRFYAQVDRQSGFQTHSILCVPLQAEQRVIGILEAINKQNGQFNENDLNLLQAISGPLAVAIENASLHSDVLAEKRRIETIFASMSEGMLTLNKEERITAINDSLLTLLRQEGEELFGRPASEVIRTRPNTFDKFLKQVFQARDDYPQLACDLLQGKEEFVPVLISGASVQDEEGKTSEAILVFSDLRQVREVERMRDDFFNNIIHELRTPLATILMYARLLREGKAEGDQAKADRFLGVIERESDRLQRMVRQMLQLAKLEAREIQRSSEPVSLKNILEQMLPPLADQATEKGLTFSQRIPTELPQVFGNEETLYMIFKNLIENAIKFTPAGAVSVEATVANNQFQFRVKDDGIGIPEQGIPNLFKRFYRTQTAVERGIAGTGLGLYMVKEGIEKHGGDIEVTSSEGKGSTFTVRLPAISE